MEDILNLPTSKHYGDYATSLCITYFLARGYQVLTPLGDRGKYDILVEKNGEAKRIQVKWTSVFRDGRYPIVSLRVCGSAKKENGGVSKTICYRYSKKDFDFIWIATPIGCYLIPVEEIFKGKEQKSDLKLFPKWDKFKVEILIPPFMERSKGHSPRLTEKQKELIKELRSIGWSYSKIAKLLNVSESCISVFFSREKKAKIERDKKCALIEHQ